MEPTETRIRTMEMVRAIREKFYEDTKDFSREELIAFIRRHAARGEASAGEPIAEVARGIPES